MRTMALTKMKTHHQQKQQFYSTTKNNCIHSMTNSSLTWKGHGHGIGGQPGQ